jgi:hypothetical protein
MKFFQHDGIASRKPEDRGDLIDRDWRYVPGYSIRGLNFEREDEQAERDREEARANGIVMMAVLPLVAMCLIWAWDAWKGKDETGGMGTAGERATTRAATGGSGSHPSTFTFDAAKGGAR